jgi:hypothetical protein
VAGVLALVAFLSHSLRRKCESWKSGDRTIGNRSISLGLQKGDYGVTHRAIEKVKGIRHKARQNYKLHNVLTFHEKRNIMDYEKDIEKAAEKCSENYR